MGRQHFFLTAAHDVELHKYKPGNNQNSEETMAVV